MTFGVMTFVVIIILTALSYFPPLALGPMRNILVCDNRQKWTRVF
jgi:K+-transporting ATPase ATPase A chain